MQEYRQIGESKPEECLGNLEKVEGNQIEQVDVATNEPAAKPEMDEMRTDIEVLNNQVIKQNN